MISKNKNRFNIALVVGTGLIGLTMFACQFRPSGTGVQTRVSGHYKNNEQAFVPKDRQAGKDTVRVTKPRTLKGKLVAKGNAQLIVPPAMQGQLTAYLATRQSGIIGNYANQTTDNPADNIFSVQLDKSPGANDRIFLVYQLTGVDNAANVSCSINDRLSMGGYLVKTDTATRRQRVEIDPSWLKQGNNRIQFGLVENAGYGYKVSNLSLEVEQNPSPSILSAQAVDYNGKVYVRGFVRSTVLKQLSSLTVDGKPTLLTDGEFEAFADAHGKDKIEVKAFDQRGKSVSRVLTLHDKGIADKTFAYQVKGETKRTLFAKGKTNELKTGNAFLIATDSVLMQGKELTATTLRSTDLPSLDQGMTNVTAGKPGVRFLPHGEHFSKQGATVSLKYDRTKIPDGYTENDIRTFYFDPKTRHWAALDRDTVDKTLCMVVSKTTHFTDMINGVIKAPESPQTEGFAPTMMNDIHPADPTSKIELMAPPVANNQGSANLSYQLELPPAPHGMSPNLSISYNSDGGSGWLGEGWDLNIPDIKVDTRWGVPRYDPNFETETYSLGGTMLAEIVSVKDSPDSIGSPSVSHRGTLYKRNKTIQEKQFYPVVNNGYSRIIRYGTAPGSYYWSVTDKNGVSYIYGAQTKDETISDYNSVSDNILSGKVTSFEFDTISNKIKAKPTEDKFIQAEWKLTEVIDLHGVYNRYKYKSIPDTISGNLTSRRLTLTGIEVGRKGYRGNIDTVFYNLSFISKTKKIKQLNNARYGFLASGQNALLDSVVVYIDSLRNSQPNLTPNKLRSYAFKYKNADAFGVDLLEKVIQLDDKNKELYTHSFDYYNNVGDRSKPTLFSTTPITYPTLNSLGRSSTSSEGGSYSAGVGGGIPFIVSAVVSYQHTFGSTSTNRDIMVADINGDGLPDKIYRNMDNASEYYGKMCFCPNNGDGTFGSEKRIEGAPTNFSYSYSNTTSDGWEGTVESDVPGVQAGISAGYDKSTTYSRTPTYLLDVNNDGLVDIVDNGTVYFNVVKYENGQAVPSFSTSSIHTANPIKNTKTVIGKSEELQCDDPIKRPEVALTDEQAEMVKRVPLQDIVRVWEAPFNGTILIGGKVKLLPCLTASDGVVLKIQHKSNDKIFSRLLITDFNDHIINPDSVTLTVNRGEKIYFRLQSGTGIFSDSESDVALLSPTITYVTGVDQYTEAGYSSTYYTSSDESMINKVGYNLVDTIPSAVVNIKGTFIKPITRSDIVCSIYMSNDSVYLRDSIVYQVNNLTNDTSRIVYKVQKRTPNFIPKKLISTQRFNKDSVLNKDISFGTSLCSPLEMGFYQATNQYQKLLACFTKDIPPIPNSKTQFWFEISSDENEKWTNIKWKPELHFKNKAGRDTIIYAGVKYNMPNKKINCSNGKVSTGTWSEKFHTNAAFSGPDQTYAINFPGTIDVDIKCDIVIRRKNNININNVPFTHITMDTNGNELSRTTGLITNNNININTRFSCTSNNLKSTLLINDTLTNYNIVSLTNGYYPVTTTHKKSYYCGGHKEYTGGSYLCIYDEWKTQSGSFNNTNQLDIFCQRTNKEMELGSMWRGWGQFEYNNTSEKRFTSPLVEDSLYMPRSLYEMDSLRNLFIYRLMPEPEKKQEWQGMTKQIFIQGDTISLGRLNYTLSPTVLALSSSPGGGGEYAPGVKPEPININKLPGFLYNESQALPLLNSSKNPVNSVDSATTTFGTTSGMSKSRGVTSPTSDLYTFTKAPVLSTTSTSISKWGGASINVGISLGASGSVSDGSTTTTSAYTDMNGDGYPDYITDDQIEYTNVRGSRDGEKNTIIPETTINDSKSIGINGSYSESSSPNSAPDKEGTTASKAAKLNNNPSISISLGASYSNNNDHSNNMYADVNGDGLPDRIREVSSGVYKVNLNLGFKFSSTDLDYHLQNHVQGGRNRGESVNLSGGIDAGYIGASISKSLSTSSSLTLYTLRDINGDGLADQIYFDSKNDCYIAYNLGNRFSDAILNNEMKFVNRVVSLASGTGYNVKVSIPVLFFFKVTGSYSDNSGQSNEYVCDDIQDINGDGIPDLLSLENNNSLANFLKIKTANLLAPNANKVVAKLSRLGCNNKLKTIANPLGGVITLEYERSKATNAHPGGKWVMSSVLFTDGVIDDGDSIKKTMVYEGGKYDRYQREFLGFASVTSNDVNATGNTIYRSIIQQFDTLNFYAKGNLLCSKIVEGNSKTGNKYSEEKNKYYNYTISKYVYPTGDSKLGKYSFKDLNLTFDSIVNRQYIVYSPLKYSQNKIYSYLSGKKDSIILSQSHYDYYCNAGRYGELKTYKYSDKGSLTEGGTGSYNYRTESDYYTSPYGLPKQRTIYDSNGHVMCQYNVTWDTLYANHLTQLKTLVSEGKYSTVDVRYDWQGNIIKKTLPANGNSNGSRMAYAYTYDPTYHQYLTEIKDTLGYSSSLSDYNYKYGVACKHTDINGNVTTTKLDNLGRVTEIKGPNEQGKDTATIQFVYNPRVKKKTNGRLDSLAYAITKHYDPANPKNFLETVTFVDGMGRVLQVKKDGFVNGQEVSLVSGRVKYDAFGRAKLAYYPTVETDLTKKYVFSTAFDSASSHIPSTRTTYDVLDRVTSTTLPDNNTSTVVYDIAQRCQRTTAFDHYLHKQESYTDGSGNTVKTVQYHNSNNKNDTLITRFHYDAINRPDTVTDPVGKTTISVYDMGGRRTQVSHPASGTTKFGYDLAGNMIWKYTANKDTIHYGYDFGRMVSVTYPRHPENNVRMVYGAASDENKANNRIGRLVSQEDGSGAQEFWYGKQGELKQVRRTLVIPNQAVATYDTKWTYDSWNRLLNMTYPDGEVVNYKYNLGGLLWQVQGNKSGVSYNYVDSIKYDKFEQRTRLRYGNGAVTTYAYNDSTRRLQNLGVLSTNINKQIMNNTYKFDRVGNIVSVMNTGVSIPSINTVSGNIGGTMEHNYKYDDLYRLEEAHGDFNKGESKSAHYDLYMGYDNMYNVVSKKQKITQTGVQFKDSLYAGYDLAYQINEGNGQQIDNIADVSYRYAQGEKKVEDNKTSRFSYDANGNLLSIQTGSLSGVGGNNSRKLLWDEENRLLASNDNGFVTSYFYDAGGERTVKISGDAEGVNINGQISGLRTGITNFTAYISPYLIVRKGGEYTKHIYIGGQRITSKVGNSGMFDTETNPLTLQKANNGNFASKQSLLAAKHKERYDSLGVSYNGVSQSGNLVSQDPSTSSSSYFYHSDHLGSSSLITDASGDVVQHLEYVPYGETFIDERRSQSSWHTPFLFSGKERDEETGLLYVSQRYQDGKYCIWYGVDQLAEKYPNMSSYIYCFGNPIKYTDPDGRNPADHAFMVFWTQGMTQAGISSAQQSEILQKAGRDGLLRYAFPYEDIRGIITGKDLDNESYNRATAAAWSLIAVAPEFKYLKELRILKISSQELKVVQYGAKHLAPAKMLWKEIVASTLKGPSKFKNAKEYVELTKKAWDEGKAVTNGKTWKVYEAAEVIGASEGKETKYMRVELTESTKELHSSPITQQQYQKLSKKQ